MKKILPILFIFFTFFSVAAQVKTEKFADAMEHFNRGKYSAAYELFSKLRKEPGAGDFEGAAAYYAAESLYRLGELDGASSSFEDFTDSFPLSEFTDAAYYKLGLIYFEQGRFYKSRQSLTRLINEHPGSPYLNAANYRIALSYYKEESYTEAEEYFNKVLAVKEGNEYLDESIFMLASLYEKTGDYESAAAHYDELLSYFRDSDLAPYAQYRIGITYFILKEYDSAVLELSDPIIKELPVEEEIEAKYLLANSFFRLEDYKNATKIYEEILDKYPEDSENNSFWYGLAWLNFQSRNYDKAYTLFNRLSLTPDEDIAPKALFWSAEAKRYAGQTDSSKYIYMKFLGKYPAHELTASVKYKLGVIFYNNGEPDRAETYLVSSLEEGESEKARVYTLLGQIAINNKNLDKAKEYFDKGVKAEKGDKETLNRAILGLATCQYFTGEYSEAAENLLYLNEVSEKFEKDKVNFYAAESFFKMKNYQNALTHFSRVSQADSKLFAEALYGKAYSFFNMKDFPDAAFYFAELLKQFPGFKYGHDALLRLADSYYGTKNFDKAAETYARAVEENKKGSNDFAYYQYAQALFKSDDYKKAISILDEIPVRFKKSGYRDDAKYLTGWIYFQRGDYTNAITRYKELLRLYPSSPVKPIALYSVGDAYYNLGEYDSSVTYYKRVLENYPDSRYVFDAMNGIQYAYIAKNEPGTGVGIIEKYTSENPNAEYSDQILFKKGEIYYNTGDYEKAQTGYKEFIATYPESPLVADAYYWIGKSASNLGRDEQALFNFEIVKESYLESDVGTQAVIEMGKIYEKRKDYGSEIKLYDDALRKIPGSDKVAELLFLKAKAQIIDKDTRGAYTSLNNLIQHFGFSIFSDKARIELGKLELEHKNYENAETLFSETGNKRKDDIGAEAQYYYGVTLLEQGKTVDAITAFVRVRSLFSMYDEWYTRSLLKLGDAYLKLNDRSKAREMYRAVLGKHKNDAFGREAERKMNNL